MARLLDKRNDDGQFPFRYVPAAQTDVAETFKRAREQQKKDARVYRIQPKESKK